MRRKPRLPPQDEWTMAVGLVWGHLQAQQPEQAYALAQGCLGIWPGERSLTLMAAYAATELLEPVDFVALRHFGAAGPAGAADPAQAADVDAWIALLERRGQDGAAPPGAPPPVRPAGGPPRGGPP